MTKRCPSCSSDCTHPFYHVEKSPINSCLLLKTEKQAIAYAQKPIVLTACLQCQFIFNSVFDEAQITYNSLYESSQAFSQTYKHFEKELVASLILRHQLFNKKIVEIGCGQGEFLSEFCAQGQNIGVGFDPAWNPNEGRSSATQNIEFIKEFYHRTPLIEDADVYLCKMTLEHIANVGDFISTLRRDIGDRSQTLVFFQVPNAGRILQDIAVEDIYYEHCSYFTRHALESLFRRNGFSILAINTAFDDQYLTIEASTGPTPQCESNANSHSSSYNQLIADFAHKSAAIRNRWIEEAETWAKQRVAIWGGGSKAVAMLSGVIPARAINCVVDINPYRQGSFLPGSGLPIVAPEYLSHLKPDTVVIMNQIYESEIRRKLESMGLFPNILLL